jgi:hypothetical protein
MAEINDAAANQAAPIAILKQARRLGRLNARLKRIEALEARAAKAGDTATAQDLADEREMRSAELSFLALKMKRAAKDYPELEALFSGDASDDATADDAAE